MQKCMGISLNSVIVIIRIMQNNVTSIDSSIEICRRTSHEICFFYHTSKTASTLKLSLSYYTSASASFRNVAGWTNYRSAKISIVFPNSASATITEVLNSPWLFMCSVHNYQINYLLVSCTWTLRRICAEWLWGVAESMAMRSARGRVYVQ